MNSAFTIQQFEIFLSQNWRILMFRIRETSFRFVRRTLFWTTAKSLNRITAKVFFAALCKEDFGFETGVPVNFPCEVTCGNSVERYALCFIYFLQALQSHFRSFFFFIFWLLDIISYQKTKFGFGRWKQIKSFANPLKEKSFLALFLLFLAQTI